jgi:hypothetical protein
MTVRDNAEIDTGTFDGFKLRLTCGAAGAAPPATASVGGRAGDLRVPSFARPRPSPYPPNQNQVLDPWGMP